MKRTIVLIAGLMLAAVTQAATVGVAWDKNTEPDLAGYTVYYATYSLTGKTTTQAQVPTIHTLDAPGQATVAATVAGLLDGTSYYFRLTAYDASRNQSGWSVMPDNVTDLEIHTFTPPPPGAPTLLTATTISSSTIRLDWTASTSTVTGYQVFRGATLLGSPTATTFNNTGLASGTQFTGYTVKAVTALGMVSAASNQASAWTLTKVPTNLAATGVWVSSASLSWTDINNGETGYKVERSPDNSTFAQTGAILGANVATYKDTGLTATTTYYFRVKAVNAGGDSAPSASLKVVTRSASAPADTTAPSIPANLTAVAVSSTQVNLSWNASTDNLGGTGVLGYQILRNGAVVGTSAGTTYSDMGLTASTLYRYTVKSYDAVPNLSNSSIQATATTLAAPDSTPPTAPPSLANGTVTPTSVTLTWGASTDTGSGVAKYWVLQGSVIVATITTPGATNSYTVTGLRPGYPYTFQVEAVDNAKNQSTASTLTVTTPAIPIGPSGMTTVETAAFPNPSVGVDPTIRAFLGNADTLEVTIYDASGAVVHSDRVLTGPTVTLNGQPYHDYVWSKTKASGVYFAVIHGKKGNDVIRGRVKFIIIR